MAQITLRLHRDPETGAPRLVVSLRTDEDSLPHEHEQRHKALVEQLLGAALPVEDRGGPWIVEREKGKPVALG
jgi:hypothetical protein